MDKRCNNCEHCKSLGYVPHCLQPYDCRCMKNNGLIMRDNCCDWFEWRGAKCKDCAYCDFEPNRFEPEHMLGYCRRQLFPRQSDGQEYIDGDTIACCEFGKK